MKNQNRFHMIIKIIGLTTLIMLANAACAPAMRDQSASTANLLYAPGSPASGEMYDTRTTSVADGIAMVNEPMLSQDEQSSIETDRVILKNASLTITVEDPEARIIEITSMAESMGGWIVNSNVYATTRADGEETTSGSITIRIPVERLNEVLERVKSDTIEVNNENITGQDVTNEYVDLSSRLKNLEATETQLQRIMETAIKVEDVLAVQRELTSVRENIEVIQGRLTYFNEAAAYASVRIDAQPKPLGPVQTQQVGWNAGTTAERALGSLVNILQGLADLAISLVIVGLPIVIIVGIPGLLIWRNRRRFSIRSNIGGANTQTEA